MNEDEVYDNLPEDPGLAFVKLEKLYRHKFEQATAQTDSNDSFNYYQMTYLNEVIAAANVLDIPVTCSPELTSN